jgi:hypothetical protein
LVGDQTAASHFIMNTYSGEKMEFIIVVGLRPAWRVVCYGES